MKQRSTFSIDASCGGCWERVPSRLRRLQLCRRTVPGQERRTWGHRRGCATSRESLCPLSTALLTVGGVCHGGLLLIRGTTLQQRVIGRPDMNIHDHSVSKFPPTLSRQTVGPKKEGFNLNYAVPTRNCTWISHLGLEGCSRCFDQQPFDLPHRLFHLKKENTLSTCVDSYHINLPCIPHSIPPEDAALVALPAEVPCRIRNRCLVIGETISLWALLSLMTLTLVRN